MECGRASPVPPIRSIVEQPVVAIGNFVRRDATATIEFRTCCYPANSWRHRRGAQGNVIFPDTGAVTPREWENRLKCRESRDAHLNSRGDNKKQNGGKEPGNIYTGAGWRSSCYDKQN